MRPRLTSPQATQTALLIQSITTKHGDILLETDHSYLKVLSNTQVTNISVLKSLGEGTIIQLKTQS
jgi:ABC-type uncharacterized transport system ATPase subunit